jgi:nucleoside-diphosphate-sugar epimerase
VEKKRIFVTGISGCVGHYLFDLLSKQPEYDLFLLIRNPGKIKFSFPKGSNIHILQDWVQNISCYSELLESMDYIIHMATSWGGKQVFKINIDLTLELLSLLDPEQCKKIICFSTASILDHNNKLLPEAEKYGTDYIKSKYRCYEELSNLSIQDRIFTFFPTVILGGSALHPFSHACKELQKAWKYLPLIKYFKIDGGFHFIHARDIAYMVHQVLENDYQDHIIVPGNPFLSVDACIDELCHIRGIKRKIKLNMTTPLVKLLPFLMGKRLSSWDRFSITYRHFKYNTTSLLDFGIPSPSPYDSLEKCIQNIDPG